MPKNILVFSDGTGKEGGKGHNSNVYKLFNMVVDRSAEQVAFYDRGLGTGWRKVTGNISGRGLSQNIRECYEFIFNHFESGDQIYLFGFSRGAATVRSLSGFIHMFGILPKSRQELIKDAYKIYKISHAKQREQAAQDFVARHHTMWTRVKFLGVWDSVAALGLPLPSLSVLLDQIPFWKHKFHNFQLSESVENAYQALAIDDERKTFHPVLWNPNVLEGQAMRQVWFSGMHSDVGGGYKETGLSDIALEWMIQQAIKCGLLIYPRHHVLVSPNVDDIMHDSRGKGWQKLFRRSTRHWDVKTRGRPIVHESVVKRTRNRYNRLDTPYEPWILEPAYNAEIEPWVRLDERLGAKATP